MERNSVIYCLKHLCKPDDLSDLSEREDMLKLITSMPLRRCNMSLYPNPNMCCFYERVRIRWMFFNVEFRKTNVKAPFPIIFLFQNHLPRAPPRPCTSTTLWSPPPQGIIPEYLTPAACVTTRICETSWPPHFLDHLWSLWKFVHKSTMWLRWQLLKNFLDPGGPLHARALWSWTFLSFIFGFKMTWEVIKSYGPIVTSLFLCHVTFSSSSSCSCWPPPGCPSWSTPPRPPRI